MNSNDNLSYAKIDWNQVHAVIEAARAERAQFLAQSLKAAFRGVSRLVLSVVDALYRAAASARLYDELSRMSDRQLADIGLRREELSRVVAQSMGKTSFRKAGQVVELPAKAAPAEVREIKRAA